MGKYNCEKEQRIQWLVKFIDIEDELEELSRRQSQGLAYKRKNLNYSGIGT